MRRPLPKTIGPYRVLRRLGGGGMAEVFLVEHVCFTADEIMHACFTAEEITQARAEGKDLPLFTDIRRRFALKRIRTNKMSPLWFFDEARVLAALNHPNIVRLVDAGRDPTDAAFYLVLEWVDGLNLRDLLKRLRAQGQTLPLPAALFIASEIAEALSYAQLVHRDIDPQNILVSRFGEAKLIDFGIARSPIQHHRTTTNVIRGKAAYMSPEHFRPDDLDGLADLFCLGIVLYEMLSGENPFSVPGRNSAEQIMHRICVEKTYVPLHERTDTVPRAISELVDQLLAFDKHERIQDPLELLAELAPYIDPEASRTLAKLVRDNVDDERDAANAAHSSSTSPATTRTQPSDARESSSREPRSDDEAPLEEDDFDDELEHEEDDEDEEEDVAPDVRGLATFTDLHQARPSSPSVSETPNSTPPAPAPRWRRAVGIAGPMILAAALVAGFMAVREPSRATPSIPNPTTARTSASDASTTSPDPHAHELAGRQGEPVGGRDAGSEPAPTTPAPAGPVDEPAKIAAKRERARSWLLIDAEPWANVWLKKGRKERFLGAVDRLDDLPPGNHVFLFGRDLPEKTVELTLLPGENKVHVKLD